jgi:2-polyprenyl-3-methyl-5-hydroxy-6-metoxy-1,4-benzoquinol methylase
MDLTEYQSSPRKKQTPRHPWETARASIALQLLRKYGLGKTSSLVDMGSGDGFVLQYLSEHQVAATYLGIDIGYKDKALKKEIESGMPETIQLVSDWEEIQTPISTPVSILAMDVLEHIERDEAFLKTLINQVQHGSILLITVPSDPSLFGSHDRQLGHFRRYTKESLRAVCASAGWTLIADGGFFQSLWIVRTLQGKNHQTGSKKFFAVENWNKPALLTNMIQSLLLLDYAVSQFLTRFGLKTPTLSLYLICKKSL